MSLPWIVKGDKTSHGGTVIEGDPAFDTHGKPVALVGHIHARRNTNEQPSFRLDFSFLGRVHLCRTVETGH
jgi:uncharacterized Zn-binding protein involved in type VI secretion